MAVNTLTDAACKKASAAGKAARKFFDGHGLFLWVSATGAKVWRIKYTQHGKEDTKVLGEYPLLSLAEARAQRDAFRRQLLAGEDVKAKPHKSITFAEAAAQYWGDRLSSGGASPSYVANATRGLAMHIEPDIGRVPVALVTDDMLLTCLLRLDAAEKFVYARRLRMWCSLVFDWAMTRKHCKANPAALIKPKTFGKKEVENHPSLPLAEVGDFMRRLALEHELQSVLACRLMALTWVRTGELRNMKWPDIHGDLWRVPRKSTKKKRVHLVPLSTQAQAILAQLKARSRGSEYVFPGERSITRPMSENAVLYLMHRMGYKGRMSGHGCRSVGSTWANENSYNKDHIEMQLSHAEDDEVRGAYNHAQYLPQRYDLLQDFGDWLEAVEQGGAREAQALAPPRRQRQRPSAPLPSEPSESSEPSEQAQAGRAQA